MYISLGVHLTETVKVGKGTWVGIGSVVSNNVNITQWLYYWCRAVVVKDITEVGTYVGVPAKKN